MDVGSVPHKVLLAMRLVATLGALVQGRAALERTTVTCMTLTVSGKQQWPGSTVVAMRAFHGLGWCLSGTFSPIMAHAVVSQEQLLVVGRVAAVGAAMEMVAVSGRMSSQVAQAHCGEGTLVTSV